MKTEYIQLPEGLDLNKLFAHRVALRTMSRADFIHEHGSGTLRKNTKHGMDNNRQYLDERTAYEFLLGVLLGGHLQAGQRPELVSSSQTRLTLPRRGVTF